MRKVAHTASKCGAMSIEHNVDATAATKLRLLQPRCSLSFSIQNQMHLLTHTSTPTHTHASAWRQNTANEQQRLRTWSCNCCCSAIFRAAGRVVGWSGGRPGEQRQQVQIKNCYYKLAQIVKCKCPLSCGNSGSFNCKFVPVRSVLVVCIKEYDNK